MMVQIHPWKNKFSSIIYMINKLNEIESKILNRLLLNTRRNMYLRSEESHKEFILNFWKAIKQEAESDPKKFLILKKYIVEKNKKMKKLNVTDTSPKLLLLYNRNFFLD